MANGDQLTLQILIKTIADAQGIKTTEEGIKQVTAEFEAAAEAGKPLAITTENVAERLKEVGKQATQAKSPLADVVEGTKKVGDAQKETSRNVQSLGQDLRQGADAGRAMSQVLQGNFAQIGSAVKGLGVLMKTNLIGVLVAIATTAATFLVPMITAFAKAKEAAEDTAEWIKKAGIAGEALGKIKLDKLREELELTKQKADDTLAVFRAMLEAQSKLSDASSEARKTAIDASPELSAVEKVTQKAAIDEEDIIRKRADEDNLRAEELKNATDKAVATAETAAKTEAELNAAREALTAAYEAIRIRAQAESAKIAALGEIARIDQFRKGEGIVSPQQEARQAEARRTLAAADATLKGSASPAQLKANLERADKIAEPLDDGLGGGSAKTARDAAAKAAADLLTRQNINSAIETPLPATRASEDQTRAIKLAEQLEKAAQQDGLTGEALDELRRSLIELTRKVRAAGAAADAVPSAVAKAPSTITKDGVTTAIAPPPTASTYTKDGVTKEFGAAPQRSTYTKDGVTESFAAPEPQKRQSTITTSAGQVIPITSETSVKEARAAGAISPASSPAPQSDSVSQTIGSAGAVTSAAENAAQQAATNQAENAAAFVQAAAAIAAIPAPIVLPISEITSAITGFGRASNQAHQRASSEINTLKQEVSNLTRETERLWIAYRNVQEWRQ